MNCQARILNGLVQTQRCGNACRPLAWHLFNEARMTALDELIESRRSEIADRFANLDIPLDWLDRFDAGV